MNSGFSGESDASGVWKEQVSRAHGNLGTTPVEPEKGKQKKQWENNAPDLSREYYSIHLARETKSTEISEASLIKTLAAKRWKKNSTRCYCKKVLGFNGVPAISKGLCTALKPHMHNFDSYDISKKRSWRTDIARIQSISRGDDILLLHVDGERDVLYKTVRISCLSMRIDFTSNPEDEQQKQTSTCLTCRITTSPLKTAVYLVIFN